MSERRKITLCCQSCEQVELGRLTDEITRLEIENERKDALLREFFESYDHVENQTILNYRTTKAMRALRLEVEG